jgi:hypothetical protein
VEITNRLALARTLVECEGAPEEIEALIQRARELVDETNARIHTPHVHAAEALLARRCGQSERFDRARQAAVESARELEAPLLAERLERGLQRY